MAYTWLTFAEARQQLAARLADPTHQYWTDEENGLYIVEALRTWNALTFTWKTTFTFGVAAASAPVWYSLGTLAGSPRLRTLTDTALYTVMEYHLLEPPTGGVWTGTSQFTIADLSTALERCRNEAIQLANTNQANPAAIASPLGQTFITIPDNFLDIPRAQWVPGTGSPTTLMRNDTTGLSYYQPDYLQTPPGVPTQYNIASLPPLSLQVDIAPADVGAYDLIALLSGDPLVPPTPVLLNVPDDNADTLKWGALADVLSRESEATDLLRSAWCQRRYQDGLTLMSATPWIMQAQINEAPAGLVSMTAMDAYSPEWDTAGPDYSTIITAGTDFFTVVPDPAADMSVTLTVLGNAPVPSADADFIQASRDVWDAILDYAQFLAAFKQGGYEFVTSQPLVKTFVTAAIATNSRLEKLGLYADVYDAEGQREIRFQERYPKE